MKDTINKILCEINDEIESYKGNDFFEDGLLDSLNFVDLVVDLSDAFNIDISAKYLKPENFKNIESIVNLITELQNQ